MYWKECGQDSIVSGIIPLTTLECPEGSTHMGPRGSGMLTPLVLRERGVHYLERHELWAAIVPRMLPCISFELITLMWLLPGMW